MPFEVHFSDELKLVCKITTVVCAVLKPCFCSPASLIALPCFLLADTER